MGKNIIESDIIRALRMVGLKNTTKKVKDFSLGMRDVYKRQPILHQRKNYS